MPSITKIFIERNLNIILFFLVVVIIALYLFEVIIPFFIAFIVIEAVLDILPIAVGGSTVTAFSAIVGLGIFIFLLSKNSTIGEHDG